MDIPRQMVEGGSSDFGPARYGDSFADVYDEWYGDVSNAEATAVFVDRFGESQRVLELGVGTGRLSTPLARNGHWVVGVDASTLMLERFRGVEEPLVSLAVGADMAVLPFASGSFDTVLVATNTLFNLNEPLSQARCFDECRRVLRLGGRMIVEAMVPAAPDPHLDRLVTTKSLTVDTAVLTATVRDIQSQEITGQHIEISETGIRMRPWKIRYSTPEQLDEMANSASFRLGDRFADWDRTPHTAEDPNAISTYVAI